MKKATSILLMAAVALLTTTPAHAQSRDRRNGPPPGYPGPPPRKDAVVERVGPSRWGGYISRESAIQSNVVVPRRDYPHCERRGVIEHREPRDRVTIWFGFAWPIYYPYWYENYTYWVSPYDSVVVTTYPSYTTYVTSYYPQRTLSAWEQLGRTWAVGLRQGSYTWEQFISYLRAYIVGAHQELADQFRYGFVMAYGPNGETAYESCLQRAMQSYGRGLPEPPPPGR